MDAAESLLRTAAQAGIDLCLANPGTTEMPLLAALDRVPGIRSVLGLFEGVCTGAADGYGRMTGRPALTLLHLGPGLANGLANLHNARRARSPVVNLIGDHASWHLAFDPPLRSDIDSLARPVSAWLRTSSAADRLAPDVAEAIAAATGPPGQVASLVLPADYQAQPAPGGALPRPAPARRRPRAASERIEALARRLRDAGATPLLLLGGSALSARGQRAAGRIAAGLGARLLAETFPARWERGGGLPACERLPYFPEQAIASLGEGSLVVLAGASDPVAFFGYEGIPSRLAPESRSACLATPEEDAEAALEDLADALALAPAATQRAGHVVPAAPVPAGDRLDPGQLGRVLARCLPEDAIVVDEAATSGLSFYAASQAGPRHTLLSLTGGAIGQGLPCATGAALACPERKVVAFQADGSGLYTLQALWTMAREGLDVVTLLCSNRAYRILQIELARAGVSAPGPAASALTRLDDPELDWLALARGCGVPGTRAQTAAELESALSGALAGTGPHLIEAML